MKLTCVLATLLATAPRAFARNCGKGKYYCGKTLLDIGDYSSQIFDALNDYGCKHPNGDNIVNTLFYCIGGGDGDIIVDDICKSCHDEGTGNDDRCSVPGGTCGNDIPLAGHGGRRIEIVL